MNRRPLPLLAGLLAVAIALPVTSGILTSADPSPSPGLGVVPTPSSSPSARATPVATSSPEPTSAPTATPAATPTPTPAPPVLADVAVVPVTHFRSTYTSVNRDQLADVLAGRSERYDALILVEDEAEAILAALEAEAPSDPKRLVLVDTAAELAEAMAANRKRLGFVRADAVTPAVRALSWGRRTLFGNDRVRDLADWSLTARLPVAPDGAGFDPATTWTLFAGGDILMDRGVHQTIKIRGKGVDFPFDGGTAEITSRYCCSSFGWRLPRTKRTGNAGAVREVISGADIAIANFENPAPNKPRWHTSGVVFTADPSFLDGIKRAGIDYLGLANNHIGDAGRAGILQTIANIEKRDIAHSGAGENEAAARTPAMLEANGTTVAILAYDRIARYYFADKDTPGSAPLSVKRVAKDVRKAREAGADVVIVFPHWGTEYRGTPTATQRQTAHDIIDAGADMIIGNHAHWAVAMEVYRDKPIWYALGNFIFDQTWSEPTMEGITLELTFHGADLAQIRMRPHIILDKAQPNFMDPAGDGQVVMDLVFGGPPGMLPW